MHKKASCIEAAWQSHHQELYRFLIKHCGDKDAADELLQRVYMQALTHKTEFCELAAPRAWLYTVAKRQWIDEQRRRKPWVDVDDIDIADEPAAGMPVDSLAACIANALPHCEADDAHILSECDLSGVKQADYARRHGLTLAATKARLRRARQRLRERLIQQCQITFDANGRICCHRALHEN